VPRHLAALVALPLLAGCPRAGRTTLPPAPVPASTTVETATEDWYPADITPPAGVEYPCALTPLPPDLAGIPAADRRYVNHCYGLLVGVIQAKQALLSALFAGRDVAAAHGAYTTTLADAAARLGAEPVPDGLEDFQQDVLGALDLQRRFFEAAVARRADGASMDEVLALPAGHEASGKLVHAWGLMSARYGAWSPEVKDSVYHHLCALDLF
jgi:hypothetical protein